MLRVTLSRTDEAAVQALYRDPRLTALERDRLEMLRLSALGLSPPRIAACLGCHPATVRTMLTRVAAHGPAGIRRTRPGPPPDTARRAQVEAALGALLDRDRTWTAAQLAAALGEEFGIILSARQTRRYLGRIAAWRRTVRTLRHKQNPANVQRAKLVLGSLKKKRMPVSYGSCTSTSAASRPASP
jgi:transposase